ncbi:sensor domain-containing protein [Achromobacter kerstersii]|uniref:sensor domain-containing protein n=1 Tax=Achromobacter kerstersii TaxID=1353890 RepID=UPI0006C88720|nr:EAL domain-containing protein [Achromobacter kerstersii]
MLDSLSDGFMSIDKSWRFTYLNNTAERYLQQERQNLLGREIWQCYPDLVNSGYYRIYRHTAATGRPGCHTGYYAPLRTWFEARSFRHDEGITVLFRDVTREHEHAAQLEFEASHDYLTGLANRRSCMEALSRAVAGAALPSTPNDVSVAVLFIDLDALRSDLRAAFAQNQFELHFQAQISLADATLIGAEALLRWRHPERGLLTPDAFLALLLESPYEGVLVDWLLNAVCLHIAAWQQMGVNVPRISLNLSARQLLDMGLADRIHHAVRKHGISAAMLDVEITEDCLVSDIEMATSVLATLKQAGLSTSLDDFGAGYSSLSYLVRLPVDTLKIDKSFVRGLAASEKASAVIRGIVGLARSLGMKTIAEGVEHQHQADELKDAGCDAIQGYLVSRPLSSDAFVEFVRRA